MQQANAFELAAGKAFEATLPFFGAFSLPAPALQLRVGCWVEWIQKAVAHIEVVFRGRLAEDHKAMLLFTAQLLAIQERDKQHRKATNQNTSSTIP